MRGGRIVVGGTNGKTTTSRMLANILERAELRVIHNRSGSNLVRGISAAFAAQSSWTGRPGVTSRYRIRRGRVPRCRAARQSAPHLLLNLFRDQLDRYGELDMIARPWRASSNSCARSAVAGQRRRSCAGRDYEDLPAQRLLFGIHESPLSPPELPHAVDCALCRRCGAPSTLHGNSSCRTWANMSGLAAFVGHSSILRASDIKLHGLDSVSLKLTHSEAPSILGGDPWALQLV